MTYYGGKEMAAAFRTVRNNTLLIAEEIPENKYEFRACPDTRTVGQLLTHIALGPSFGFLVSERLIDPEMHEQLLPMGKLELPAEPSLWPDSEAIAYHRTNIFDRD